MLAVKHFCDLLLFIRILFSFPAIRHLIGNNQSFQLWRFLYFGQIDISCTGHDTFNTNHGCFCLRIVNLFHLMVKQCTFGIHHLLGRKETIFSILIDSNSLTDIGSLNFYFTLQRHLRFLNPVDICPDLSTLLTHLAKVTKRIQIFLTLKSEETIHNFQAFTSKCRPCTATFFYIIFTSLHQLRICIHHLNCRLLVHPFKLMAIHLARRSLDCFIQSRIFADFQVFIEVINKILKCPVVQIINVLFCSRTK